MKGREWVNTCRMLVAVEAPNEKLAKGGAAPLDLSSPEGKGPDPEREGPGGREEAACWTEEKEQTVFTEEGCSYL